MEFIVKRIAKLVGVVAFVVFISSAIYRLGVYKGESGKHC